MATKRVTVTVEAKLMIVVHEAWNDDAQSGQIVRNAEREARGRLSQVLAHAGGMSVVGEAKSTMCAVEIP
jgi:hypothetical protein